MFLLISYIFMNILSYIYSKECFKYKIEIKIQQKVVMTSKKEEEIDPSIYQYDQIYDDIKHMDERQKQRSRSREKEKEKKKQEKAKQSKYISRMKQIAADRHKDHELAHEKNIRRENQKLGINEEMVFVTQSYLKKKQEEKQAIKKRLQQQKKSELNQVEKGSYLDFKKKMLDQAVNLNKK